MDANLRKALVLSFLFSLGLTLAGVLSWSYDAYTHMFFADHYRRDWFNTWEYKWYTGFSVVSYPPLLHQLVALPGFVLGTVASFPLVNMVLMTLVPLAVYVFVENTFDKRAAGLSALISVFMPGIIASSWVFGQMSTIFGLVLTLLLSAPLRRFLLGGSTRYLVASSLVAASVAASHHLTFLLFLPALASLLVLSLVVKGREHPTIFRARTLLARTALFAVLSTAISLVVMWPFWDFVLQRPPQAEIAHLSRGNILADPGAFALFFLSIYGFTVFLAPLALRKATRTWRLFPFLVLLVPFFLLGLGGTTPLPALVFGDSWRWLTYDRFALWSSVMMIPILATVLRSTSRRLLVYAFFVGLAASGVLVWAGNFIGPLQPERRDLDSIAGFLAEDGRWRWRYVTLGFGNQVSLLSVMTNASTVDGDYPTGRTLSILRASGVEKLDGAKFWGNGTDVLGMVLEDAPLYSTRWVFSGDRFYDPVLEDGGFVLVETFPDGTDLWEREDVPQVARAGDQGSDGVMSVVWGIGPLVVFFGALLLMRLR